MTLTEQISLVGFAVIVTFGMAAYLRSHSRYENGIFHRVGCFFLYGYLKFDLAVAYLKHAAMTRFGSICSNYQIQDELYHKEQRLRDFRMDMSHKTYEKSRYNLKILDK